MSYVIKIRDGNYYEYVSSTKTYYVSGDRYACLDTKENAHRFKSLKVAQNCIDKTLSFCTNMYGEIKIEEVED